ncbi:hypothetical protein CGLO_14411 [Colletotrichum gloeosporioides Cg-14]|uniref:Uncharacterized protein n=1 Tax=Colletotrichum gloeosporioides (strain Cg-14) TaxID=1237896 RepID=T0K416_COLGC|nr:hypothetical protein CGLO_14411 [Colletotrichum gloeosporioides Cg-14]
MKFLREARTRTNSQARMWFRDPQHHSPLVQERV